jgi:hypothetical protein
MERLDSIPFLMAAASQPTKPRPPKIFPNTTNDPIIVNLKRHVSSRLVYQNQLPECQSTWNVINRVEQ